MKGLVERHCLALKKEEEHLSERQEVLTVLMESKTNMQRTAPEKYWEKITEELKERKEQRTKEALELLQKKHKLINWQGVRGPELTTIPLLVRAHPLCPLTQTKQCRLPLNLASPFVVIDGPALVMRVCEKPRRLRLKT